MSGFIARSTLHAFVDICLSEEEARAIHDLGAFGADSIVAKLAELSPAWASKFGPGFAKLMDRVRQDMGAEIERIDLAKAAFRRQRV